MAGGHPKFGGTNGVALLDIGQIGGARECAGTARFSGRIIPGGDRTRSVEHAMPQQNVIFRDLLGFDGARILLEGVIRASTNALMNTILQELNERKHGSLRETSGALLAVNLTMIKETQLTDFDGNALSDRVVLDDWRQRGRRLVSQQWAAMVNLSMIFRAIG